MKGHLAPILLFAAIVGGVALALWLLRARVAIVGEFVAFLFERKLWWMTPIALVFLLLCALALLTQNAAIAPFIYTLF